MFVKPHNIKYSSIHFLAIILGALNRYHQEFAITVVDELLENITLGLEDNDFKFNQRRIAEVKYLGELYVYRMVDSSIIFDTLFKLCTFGHGELFRSRHVFHADIIYQAAGLDPIATLPSIHQMTSSVSDLYAHFLRLVVHTTRRVPLGRNWTSS